MKLPLRFPSVKFISSFLSFFSTASVINRKKSGFSLAASAVGSLVLLTASQMDAGTEASRHQFWVSAGTRHYSNSKPYSFEFHPYISSVDKDLWVRETTQFEVDDSGLWGLGYRYPFAKHWSIQVDVANANGNFRGTPTPIDFSYSYQTYNYWSQTWGRTIQVDEEVINPRQPHGTFDRWDLGSSLVYEFPIRRFRVAFQAGLTCAIVNDAEIQDFYVRIDSLGSRSILFPAEAFIDTKLEDTTMWGARIGTRISYPLSRHMQVFADFNYSWYPETKSELRLTGYEENEDSWGYWWVQDEQLADWVNLETFRLDAETFSSQFGIAVQF